MTLFAALCRKVLALMAYAEGHDLAPGAPVRVSGGEESENPALPAGVRVPLPGRTT